MNKNIILSQACSYGSNQQLVSPGSCNGVSPVGCQYITWTNIVLVLQGDMASLGNSEFIVDGTTPKHKKNTLNNIPQIDSIYPTQKQHFQVSTLVILASHKIFSCEITNQLYQSNKKQIYDPIGNY